MEVLPTMSPLFPRPSKAVRGACSRPGSHGVVARAFTHSRIPRAIGRVTAITRLAPFFVFTVEKETESPGQTHLVIMEVIWIVKDVSGKFDDSKRWVG